MVFLFFLASLSLHSIFSAAFLHAGGGGAKKVAKALSKSLSKWRHWQPPCNQIPLHCGHRCWGSDCWSQCGVCPLRFVRLASSDWPGFPSTWPTCASKFIWEGVHGARYLAIVTGLLIAWLFGLIVVTVIFLLKVLACLMWGGFADLCSLL